MFGNVRAMFLSMNDQYVTLVGAVVAGLLAALAAAWAGHTFARDNRSVHDALAALREGRLPDDLDRRLSGEMHALRTELDLTARTLAESRAREVALESSRRELIAWVSHDLRTPLAGLQAMAEALEDGVASDPPRYHRQIRVEVERLTDMVTDLFEISRLQAGAAVVRSDRVSLTDLVSDCVAALEPVAGLQGVRLVGRSSGSAEVIGSSAELNRALTNLLVNAIRHTAPHGTVEIALCAPAETGSGTAAVTVRDQCGGIAHEDLERVFDVGFRAEPARTPGPGLGVGAGLGLAITRGIVDAHEGTVDVLNADGGCQFTVRLPVAA